MRNIQAFRDQSALKKAEALVEKAAEYIQIEFGTLSLVRRVGGLADIVIDTSPENLQSGCPYQL